MKIFHLFAILAVATLASGSAVAEIFRWTDAQGHPHYSDNPPAESKTSKVKIHVQSISGPATVTTLDKAPGAALSVGVKEKIKLYTTTWCGYCKRAKAYLALRGIGYEELDAESSEQGKREFAALGGRGVPVILVGRQRMNGYGEARLAVMLEAAGY